MKVMERKRFIILLTYFMCCCQNGVDSNILENCVQDQINPGKIKLVLGDSLNQDQVTIIQRNNNTLIEEGKLTGHYNSKYGWSCFLLIYENDTTSEECYFKKNYHEVNDHIFHVFLDDEFPRMKLLIKDFNPRPYKYYSKWYYTDSLVCFDDNHQINYLE